MLPDRRHFLEMVGIAAVTGSLPPRIGAVAEERSADVGTEPADYTIRIGTGTLELAPDHIVSTTLYNGQFPGPLIRFKEGQRAVVDIYNDNGSDDIHPLHLHRHSFELVRIGGEATAGVIKDVVMLGGFQEIAFDFVADNPGRTLFHCHQQLHMDFGFMALFDYA